MPVDWSDLASDQPVPQFKALPEEEREGILRSLANIGMAPLKALNYVLDIPGRPVRTALAGHWSDVLPSIVDPSHAVSGEDLAKQWGLLNESHPDDAWTTKLGHGLTGAGIEMLTNPFTYFNPLAPLVGGATNAAGKAAAKIGTLGTPIGATTGELAEAALQTGKLAPTMASRILAKQGSLFPYNIGTGPTALNVAETIGQGQEWLGKTLPFRVGAGLFNRAMESQTGQNIQRILSRKAELQPELEAGERTLISNLARTLGPDGGAAEVVRYQEANPQLAHLLKTPNDVLYAVNEGLIPGLPNSPLGRAAEFMEKVGQSLPEMESSAGVRTILDLPRRKAGRAAEAASQPLALLPEAAEAPGAAEAASQPRALLPGVAEAPGGAEAAGQAGKLMVPPVALPAKEAAAEAAGQAGKLMVPGEIRLGPDLRYYAPSSVNPIHLEDPLFRPPGSRLQLPLQAAQKEIKVPREALIGGRLGVNAASLNPAIGGALRAGKSLEDVEKALIAYRTANAAPEDITKLAKSLGMMNPEGVKAGIPYYNTDYFGQWAERLADSARVQASAQAMLEGIKKLGGTAEQIGPGAVPVAGLLQKGGFGGDATTILGPATHVPAEVAKDLMRYFESFAKAGADSPINPILKGWDAFTGIYKTLVSGVWAPSRIRDFTQGQFMNVVKGLQDPRFNRLDPRSVLTPIQDARAAFINGGVIADAPSIPAIAARITAGRKDLADPAKATKYLTDLADAWGLIRPGTAIEAKAAALSGKKAPYKLPGSPLEGIFERQPEGTWNPLAIRGMPTRQGLREETTWKPAVAGSRAVEQIDVVNRGSAFISGLRQGMTPEAAAKAALAAAYDYGNLSRFERSVMQRVIPFYNFMRQNMPAQLEELVKNPGGALANSIRVTEALRQGQGFVPEQVGEGLAIPIGQKDEQGRQTYLHNFGLPYEEALGPVEPSLKGTFRNVISSAHPLIKGPIELGTGINTFTGRPLSESADLIDYTPLSRLVSTGRRVVNTLDNPLAAGLGLVSPVRLKEANVDKARNQAVRDAISELLQSNPDVHQHMEINVPRDKRVGLSPRDQMLLQVLQSLQQKKKPATAASQP